MSVGSVAAVVELVFAGSVFAGSVLGASGLGASVVVMVIVAVAAVLVLPVVEDDEDEEVETMTVAVAVAPLVVKVVMLVVMVTVLPEPAVVITNGGVAGLRAGALVTAALVSRFFVSASLASGVLLRNFSRRFSAGQGLGGELPAFDPDFADFARDRSSSGRPRW